MAQTRITAGAWRGRVIATPRGLALRPTRSLVREALFNMLGDRVVDARVLDLYAGSGSLGFEALSRGAGAATFVERDREALQLIASSADRFGCADRCTIAGAEVVSWLRRNSGTPAAVGLCFLDAPYQDPSLTTALELLGASPPSVVVCEHHRARRLPDMVGGLRRTRQARYGLTDVSIYQGEQS